MIANSKRLNLFPWGFVVVLLPLTPTVPQQRNRTSPLRPANVIIESFWYPRTGSRNGPKACRAGLRQLAGHDRESESQPNQWCLVLCLARSPAPLAGSAAI